MKRKAFTMLELVFAIVVIGIIASLAMPRIDRDIRQEAADNVLSAIRYTQHLALMDDKTNPADPQWQLTLWNIRFSNYTENELTKWFYTIGSNMNHGANIAQAETAIDPTNGKYMYHLAGDSTLDETDESKNIFIGDKYGINKVDFATGCNVQTGSAGNNANTHIAFDYLGRPHKGMYSQADPANDYATVMQGDCTIAFGFEDGSIPDFQITILRETGYAFIVGQPDS